MPKTIFLGSSQKEEVKQQLVNTKEQIDDELTPVANGGSWPIVSAEEDPRKIQDAIEILRKNNIVFANMLAYLYKQMETIERQLNEPK